MDLFDKADATLTGEGERAVLVHMDLPDSLGREDLEEFHHLVVSSGVIPVAELLGKRDRPDAALFIGSGKVEELAALVEEHEADVVLFNHALSPGQERNHDRSRPHENADRSGDRERRTEARIRPGRNVHGQAGL